MLALLFDEGYWWAAVVSIPQIAILTAGGGTTTGLVLALATSLLTLLLLALVFRRRRHRVRLLERGVVAPAKLVDRREVRFGSIEQTRTRVLPGWDRRIALYDGPLSRTTMRIGLDDGPSCEVVRSDAEWGEDLCLFDPAQPRHHVFIEDLPPFVDVDPKGGWGFVAAKRQPAGGWCSIASAFSGIAYALALALVVPVLVALGIHL